jgi:hypothetical protein
MKIFKSPGIDGFTVEFYKFFWNDIKIPLVKCLNESLDNGKFSVSQRQGLITCIPEPLNRNESGRFGALKSDSTHLG